MITSVHKYVPGTKLLMFNGKIITVDELKVGMRLMGADNEPLKVTKLFKGVGELYRIIPKDGTEPYVLTGDHVLTLRYNTRPKIKYENARNHERYRLTYADRYKQDNLDKVKIKTLNFGFSKYGGKEKAFSEANKMRDQYNSEFDTAYPHHEITIEEYLGISKSFKHRLALFRQGVNYIYNYQNCLDSYFLGLWLGDGTSAEPAITSIDLEIIDFIHTYANNLDMKVTKGKISDHNKGMTYRIAGKVKKKNGNTLKNFLREENLLNNKHIPFTYLNTSRQDRLKLLAGIIDTDGSFTNNTYYTIVQKSIVLSHDIVYLARSLGFWCHIKPRKSSCIYKGIKREAIYQYITLGGDDINEIPVLLPRKRATYYDRHIDSLNYKFDIEYIGKKKINCFEVEGTSSRIISFDFTVTNCCLVK